MNSWLFWSHRVFFIWGWREKQNTFNGQWNISRVMKSIFVRNFSLCNTLIELLIFIIRNFSFIPIPNSLHWIDDFSIKFNRISDEQRKLFQNGFNFSWLREISAFRSQKKFDLRSSIETNIACIKHFEFSTSVWNPSNSSLRVTFWDNFNTACNNECGVEPNSELTNDVLCFSVLSQVFYELLWTWFSNRSKIINDFLLCHSNTWVKDGHCSILFVCDNIDV